GTVTTRGVPESPEVEDRLGSSDVGNVSQVVPTIQPLVKIAPDGTAIHSRAFEAAAVTPLARQGLLAAAKAMAMTAVDLLGDASLLARVKQDFQRGWPHERAGRDQGAGHHGGGRGWRAARGG